MTMKQHLKLHRRDPLLCRSMLGGDPVSGYPFEAAWFLDYDRNESVNFESAKDESHHLFEGPTVLDQHHDVHGQFLDAVKHADGMYDNFEADGDADDNHAGNNASLSELEDLYAHVSYPLYPRSKVSLISTVVVIFTMCSTHNVTNVFVDELLKYLASGLLSNGNVLPWKHYTVKKMVKMLGLSYNVIQACSSGHVLFRNDLKDVDKCRVLGCGKSRYVKVSNTIPTKVIMHFPLIH